MKFYAIHIVYKRHINLEVQKMQSKGKSIEGLKLQSYKVDSQILASKINELNELKSELENTLSKHRTQQNSIYDELEQLKAENQKLRALVSDLEFTKKSQAYLIIQLQKKLQVAQNNTLTYSQRLEKQVEQKQEMKQFYEKKISTLNQSIEQQNIQINNLQISKVKEFRPSLNSQQPLTISDKSISSIDQNSRCDSHKKIKKLKKPSIQSESPIRPSIQIANKYQTPNIILQKEEDSHLSGQDAYLEMIRQLYKQLLKIQIRGPDLFKIPQIQAFSRLKNPSKNDLAKLCRSYPFHINDADKIQLIYNFILKQSERRGIPLNGRFVVDQIIQQIEDIDYSQGPKSEEQISSSALDSEMYFPFNQKGKGKGEVNMVKASEVGNKKNPNRNSAYSLNDSGFSSNY